MTRRYGGRPDPPGRPPREKQEYDPVEPVGAELDESGDDQSDPAEAGFERVLARLREKPGLTFEQALRELEDESPKGRRARHAKGAPPPADLTPGELEAAARYMRKHPQKSWAACARRARDGRAK